MTKIYGRAAAVNMIAAALGMRLFVGLAVDYPAGMNAAWICPLLGLVIYLPFALAICRMDALGNGSTWEHIQAAMPRFISIILALIFALALLYDAAVTLRLTASSSNIIALGDDTVYLLIVPLGLVAGFAVILGGDALGSSARIALRTLPLFAIIVLLVQLPSYRIGWLTPALGSGIGSILTGAIYCAGCMALLSLPWLLALPDRGRRGLLRAVILPAVGVSVLLVMQCMSAPAMPRVDFTRAARIELVLSNGRLSLYPQFVLNLLWYGGLLYLLTAEVVAASAFLQKALPGVRMWMLGILIALAVSVIAVYNPAWLKQSSSWVMCLFMCLGGLLVLPMLFIAFARRGEEA